MSAATRLVGFGAILAVLFAVATAAGGALDPDARGEEREDAAAGHAGGGEPAGHAEDGGHEGAAEVHGLAVANDAGLQLEVLTPELRRGREQRLAFRVVDARGVPVRDYDVEHERRMHLIVVRRDLTGFQHLHPDAARRRHVGDADRAARGRLLPRLRRLLARRRGDDARLRPARRRPRGPARAARAGDAPPTRATATRSAWTRAPCTPAARRSCASRSRATASPSQTEPYLGAGGHLVALREGDLAFLHVHPVDGLGFMATFPSPGRYRLFLQFKHEGEVRTAAFTQAVGR